MVETFLVRCLKQITDLETFDDLCLASFSCNAFKLDLEKKLLAPQLMQGSILRACYQVQLWVQAPFRDAYLFVCT